MTVNYTPNPSPISIIHERTPSAAGNLSLRQACSQLLPSFQLTSSEVKGPSRPYCPSLPYRPQSFAQDKAVTFQSQVPQEPWYGMLLQALYPPEFSRYGSLGPHRPPLPPRSGPKMCRFQLRRRGSLTQRRNKSRLTLKGCLISINGCKT